MPFVVGGASTFAVLGVGINATITDDDRKDSPYWKQFIAPKSLTKGHPAPSPVSAVAPGGEDESELPMVAAVRRATNQRELTRHLTASVLSGEKSQKLYDWGDATNVSLAKYITANDEARTCFAEGLAFMLNYNHEQAIAKFQEALEKDSKCAMAWWGIAYSVSSNYNWPPGLGSGHDACEAAKGLINTKGAVYTVLERDLINALGKRHSLEAKNAADPTKLSMGNDPALNAKFAESMGYLFDKYKDDADFGYDVTAIYVESLMNLKPWALWSKKVEGGEMVITPADQNTVKLINILEDALGIEDGDLVPKIKHPALLHLYCHAMELSPTPERAVPVANALWHTMPDAGHLVHMPAHIYAWAGMWNEGVNCNKEAVAADEKYRINQFGFAKTGSQFYKFYRMHNMHFVVWCAMHEGRYAEAMEYARKAEAANPAGPDGVEFMLAGIIPMGAVFLESYVSMPWHVMVRFGKWDDILDEPIRTDSSIFPGAIVVQHYARGVAFASKGMVAEAEAEQAKFIEACANPSLEGRVQHNVPIKAQNAVQAKILKGEIEYRKAYLAKKAGDETADFTPAWKSLEEGVNMSLELPYNEPWGQMQPVRHILGALKLEQGLIEEAEAVYRADIKLWKNNMWGLLGLKLCLEKKAQIVKDLNSAHEKFGTEIYEELSDVSQKFALAAARADGGPPKATCYCAQAAFLSGGGKYVK